jgi:Cu(I)/Ag(I) efflux system membrane protein CusA/SilA
MSTGTAPMIGGVISSFILELIVYPAIYQLWRGWQLRKSFREKPPREAIPA